MKLWKKLALGGGGVLIALIVAAVVLYRINNVPPELQEPNLFAYYKSQDTVPEGKVGVYASLMLMPETYDEELYYNVFFKPLTIIPWPIREFLKADNGTPLYDEKRFFEFEEFEPTRLIDHRGEDRDVDGVPYVEKYKAGEIEFVERTGYTPGYFLYPGRDAGMPTGAAELMAKARVYYHAENAGLVDGRVPHETAARALVADAMARIQARYGDVPWRLVNAELDDAARKAMHSLLDEGVDTVIFAPPRLIYSHYEEFNSSFRKGLELIDEWEAENGKDIKVIIAPQWADFDVARDAYLNMLRERLATLPAGSSVKVVASIHGMPWDVVPNEAWLELSPPYREKIVADAQAILETEFNLGRTEVVVTQDHFAEMSDLFPSTNEAFWSGIRDGYDYVINFPMEFYAETTDTLFAHAVVNFEGFDDYDVYEPIEYTNWDEPFTRTFVQDGTTVIYNGVPVGRYRAPLVEAYVQSIGAILSQREDERMVDAAERAAD